MKKWKITKYKAVLHYCKGKWRLYRNSPWSKYEVVNVFGVEIEPYIFYPCECNLRRPPNKIRRMIKLIDLEHKLRNF